MQINREKVIQAFQEYVSHYDMSDGKIKLKIDHTYRVANLCERIAKSLGLDSQDIDLAWLLGMLHDIGRFEQLKNYGTFSDADSIDHAHLGVKILFDDCRINDYLEGEIGQENSSISEQMKKDLKLVRTAIWNHSAFRLEEGLDKRTQMFCDILRDGDKVDILKVNHDVPVEVIYNVSTEELKNAVISEEVMKQFLERHTILRSVKRTSVDNIVGHGALVFELVYPESLSIVKEQGYLDKLLGFQSDNPVTQKQFVKLKECMEEYLRERV